MNAIAYIGLGANLGEPELKLREARDSISSLPKVRLIASSSLYKTAPLGFSGQPDFVNAVVSVETNLPPEILLQELLEIEEKLGRTRVPGERDQPRIIDCDLLMYSDLILDRRDLQLPHPRMKERLFVLAPLRELVPGIKIPGSDSIDQLCERCLQCGQRAEVLGGF